MGLLDFLFKKKKAPELNYENIIQNSWNLFRQGFQNPSPEIRRIVEEAILNLETPDGKRFFAVGMQDPDINNRVFCLKKVYERGGWRLAENVLKIAYAEEPELSKEEILESIYFFGSFSDPDAANFMEVGLLSPDEDIRIATICAISGVKGAEKEKLILEQIKKVTNDLEKFCCAIALYQFNNLDGKKIIEELLEKYKDNMDFVNKLNFLEFYKSKIYVEMLANSTKKEIKNTIIPMIKDNRGIETIKKLLKDPDEEVSLMSIKQTMEIGSRSILDIIKELKNNPKLENMAKITLSVFGEKEYLNEINKKANSLGLTLENIELLKYMGMFPEQNVSEIIDKIILPINDLDALSKTDQNLLNKLIEILIKYGKITSIDILEKFCDSKYIEQENIEKTKIVYNSAVAILCIIERNSTYYTLRKKMQEEGNQS